ncbi:alpha/beta hydrolase [Spirilliplanes yamanashiensis]|uniref:Serine aminopeptidase S33 domain-containing protein n=1 Tax=Spirilliplanes yamanashiensis TaxID=42233 RepID=A0A8J3YFK0_9ACTN|nr:alpha/beta fold hydrolase [Spirilliplanes yamanashiensis]MDP9818206.1 fermentation-respiration switch protein FrsA (DUF1100 family) [Spirilliplanes yamanashiensis]GIJ06767.1 hypothetical protein Sya03_61190 [Spirilliplanes yamanashiensis]
MTQTRDVPRTRTAATAPRRPVLVPLTVAAGAAATGYLAGRDGAPGWQAVRVAAVLAVALGVVITLRHGSRWLHAAVASGAGLAAAALGAGIGPRWLDRTGWTPVAVAGLVALVAGAVLLMRGAATVVAAVPRWAGVPAAAALLVVAWVVLWAGIHGVAATNVPPTAVGGATPASSGLAYTDVEVRAADGVRLSGWYVPSRNAAAVVLRHGAGSTRSAVLPHAAVLARHGYGVLLLDARGHGLSGGRAMDFGWYGDVDVAAGVTYLQQRDDVADTRIAVAGLSMGGEEAIGAAATDHRIRAVVAEGATGRVAADKAFLAGAYGVRGRLQQVVDRLTTGCTDLLTDARPPGSLRAAAAAGPPVLLITAGAVDDEALAARFIQDGSPRVEVWTVRDAGHTAGLATAPAAWEERVTSFLASALAG